MKKFEVLRHYTVTDVYEVEAADAEEAYKKACDSEYISHKSYDASEDDDYEVLEILVEGAA